MPEEVNKWQAVDATWKWIPHPTDEHGHGLTTAVWIKQ
jgi:hypothetical protein